MLLKAGFYPAKIFKPVFKSLYWLISSKLALKYWWNKRYDENHWSGVGQKKLRYNTRWINNWCELWRTSINRCKLSTSTLNKRNGSDFRYWHLEHNVRSILRKYILFFNRNWSYLMFRQMKFHKEGLKRKRNFKS